MSRVIVLGLGLIASASLPAQAEGDAVAGEAVFKRCAICHAVDEEKNGVGPTLLGLFGRTSGTVEGFNYSPAIKNAAIDWDAATLDGYLADPKTYIPGNRMTFPGLKKAEDRANVIAYLEEATAE